MDLKLRQVAFSDILILNKVDLAGPEQMKQVLEWINGTFRSLRVVETNECDVPLEILLSVGRFDPARLSIDRPGLELSHCADKDCRKVCQSHEHSEMFSTWSYETNQPMSLDALRKAAGKLPGNIYRAKGIIYASDAPEREAVLQVVGRRVDISMQEKWDKRIPRTQIVIIAAAGSIDTRVLEAAFAACISDV